MGKKEDIVLLFGFSLMVVFIIICSVTKRAIFGYVGFAFAIIVVVLRLVFVRCPECGRPLGIAGGKYCPYCGKKIK